MPFPVNAQYTPILINGVPLFDVTGDESPASTDIVGNSTFPAGYVAYDGTNVYFRLRLNEDPRNSKLTGFQNFAWGVLVNTSGVAGTYDWLISVSGLDNRVNIIRNTNKLVNSWNDPAEGTGDGTPNFSQPISNFDFARVTQANSSFGGTPDFFLDWFLPANTVFSLLGINLNSLLRLVFFTSTNRNNYNKDSLRSSEGFSFANALSQPIRPSETDIRAKLQVNQSVLSGPSTVLLGQTASWTVNVTVTNNGLSAANTVFATDTISLSNVSSFVVNTTSQGLVAYNPTSQLLSWNVGNLNAGATATLTFTVTGSFTSLQTQYVLGQAQGSGFDSFTGSAV